MMMKALPVQSLQQLLEAIRQSARLVAPVEQDGIRLFRPVEDVSKVVLGEGNTAWSFKEYLFPRTEPLFRYRFAGGAQVELAEPELPEGETVIFGARPCDAAGLAVLDAVFSWDYDNPFYCRRREQTTIIGLSCAEPADACFCTAVGLSPTGTAGSDLLLTRVGNEYLAEPVTEKGERLLQQHAALFTDTSAGKEEATKAAEGKMRRKASIILNLETPLEKVFDNPAWEEMARACLGCGACAFVCPTCHCFDIVDEGDACGGSRCKNWDSCGFALFTVHTSGHNPRADQAARYRQRVLHKLRYIPERFGVASACVGCGRCVATCPAGMDIYEVATQVAR